MTSIALITENFVHPWYPNDIDTFLAGCQECTVLFSEALQRKGYDIDVFTLGKTPVKTQERHNVLYRDFSLFPTEKKYSTVILFKVIPEYNFSCNVIYWSSDIEKQPVQAYIKNYVCLTLYHKARNRWDNAIVIPHGIDKQSLLQYKNEPRDDNAILYSSSPDRGLYTLLKDWEKIKSFYPELKLYITYGYKIAKQLCEKNIVAEQSENIVKQVCSQKDVYYLGDLDRQEFEKLYFRCKYWVLPLNKPEAELFCLNAVKAQLCGCIPIINRIGALDNTVKDYTPYYRFIQGDNRVVQESNTIPSITWDEVVDRWSEILI